MLHYSFIYSFEIIIIIIIIIVIIIIIIIVGRVWNLFLKQNKLQQFENKMKLIGKGGFGFLATDITMVTFQLNI